MPLLPANVEVKPSRMAGGQPKMMTLALFVIRECLDHIERRCQSATLRERSRACLSATSIGSLRTAERSRDDFSACSEVERRTAENHSSGFLASVTAPEGWGGRRGSIWLTMTRGFRRDGVIMRSTSRHMLTRDEAGETRRDGVSVKDGVEESGGDEELVLVAIDESVYLIR